MVGILRDGVAWEEINTVAKEIHADLIIIGHFSPTARVVPFLALPIAVLAGCQRQSPNASAQTPYPPTAAAPAAAGDGVVPVAATAQLPTTPAPFATPPLLPGTPDVAGLVAKIKPSVVNITAVHEIRGPRMEDNFPFGFDPFGPGHRRGGGDQVQQQQALGSGFIVDATGHVVTNAHVVDDADQVKVKLADEREFSAKVVGRDKRLDLAVLELRGAKDLPAAALGSSEQLRVGEYVVAIGNPFGLGHTVTMGIVSAKDRAIGAGPYDDFIQTDASINPGNSGGPLFNLKGEVIGINTAINPNGRGIGFAIPVDALKDVLSPLISTGHVARGRLGVAIQPVDAALGKALGAGGSKGALVAEVEPNGPADRAGLKAGDVIASLDGTPVPTSEDLPRIVARHAPGSRSKLEILRNGKRQTVDVTLDELKEETARADAPQASPPGTSAPQGLGIEIGESPQRKGEVIVGRVVPGGAADGQLLPGDVILEVNRSPVHRTEDVVARTRETPTGSPVLFKIRREGKSRFAAVERR
jgi:serine protease Do